MKNIFLSVDGVGVITKTNFSKRLPKRRFVHRRTRDLTVRVQYQVYRYEDHPGISGRGRPLFNYR